MSIASNFPAIKPTLLLDFATTEQLDPRITFTRASTATYYGTQTAKAEENLLLYSQEFDNSSGWGVARGSRAANVTTAPDGTSTADSLNQTSGLTVACTVFSASVSCAAAVYTYSVFLKPNSKPFAVLRENVQTGSNLDTWFNISAGTVGTTGSGHTASIVSVGNGWYRCIITFTSNAARSGLFSVFVADSDASLTVTGTDGIYLWGAQLEQRSAVSAYTATTTQPITNYIPVLQTAASGVARFDHNPTTFESLGLLIEEQRTNLLTYSEQFDNAAWTKSGSSITANTVVSPDGTLDGDKLIENAASSTHFTYGSVSVTSGTAYTFTLYAKSGERTAINPSLTLGFPAGSSALFNLSTGIATPGASATASMVSVGNGWYRCSFTATANSTTSANAAIYLYNGAVTYTGDGYSGLYIWGAQLEAGAFATSYIPTVASQVTRAADSASMTGTNFSSWYNAAEGTIYAESALTRQNATVGAGVCNISDGATNSDIALFYRGTGATGAYVRVSTTSQADFTPTGVLGANVSAKLTISYKVNDFAACGNGGTVGTDTSGSIPIVNQMAIGNSLAALNGTIKKLAYYPIRVSNTNLQALTS